MLKIKYDGDFSFEIDTITEHYDANMGMKNLTFSLPIKDDIKEVEESFVPENLKLINVIKNGEIISTFKDYTKVQSTQKIINKMQQILNVTLTKGVI